MTIERLDCVLENFVGEPYAGMQVDPTGSYVRVQDILDRISAIAKAIKRL